MSPVRTVAKLSVIIIVACGLWLGSVPARAQDPEPPLQFSCIWWDSVNSQPPPGRVLQMGTCFNTDRVARAYVVNLDGRGWEPVDKTRCTPRLGQEHPFECFVRFTKLYYGLDRQVQIAEADDLTRQSGFTHTRHVVSLDDESFSDVPMVPGFNQMIDEPGSEPLPGGPPVAPTGVSVK